MPTKTINQVVTSVAAAQARITFDISDNHDDGTTHPACLFAEVRLRDTEVQFIWLENVTRAGAPVEGIVPITGRVPVNGYTAPQIASIKTTLLGIFNKAAAVAGYV